MNHLHYFIRIHMESNTQIIIIRVDIYESKQMTVGNENIEIIHNARIKPEAFLLGLIMLLCQELDDR